MNEKQKQLYNLKWFSLDMIFIILMLGSIYLIGIEMDFRLLFAVIGWVTTVKYIVNGSMKARKRERSNKQ